MDPATGAILAVALSLALLCLARLVWIVWSRTVNQRATQRQGAPRVAFVTCVTGRYEATLKEPVAQTVPCDFYAFTDKPGAIKTDEGSVWKIRSTSAHVDDERFNDRAKYRNALGNNSHPFNVAKFYKCSMDRIPELAPYDVLVWLDGTIKIIDEKCAEFVGAKLLGGHFDAIAYRHEERGDYMAEMEASRFDRYMSTSWGGHSQPVQDPGPQARAYEEGGLPMHVGLWITCFVAFNMATAKPLLNAWAEQVLTWTTQDQVSFPYAVWKTGARVYSLPDGGDYKLATAHSRTDMYVKHGHGA